MSMQDALKIIISKSPDATNEAVKCLQAISARSPIVQVRYNRVVELAMSDRRATFTPDERATIAEALEVEETGSRDFTIRVRLTQNEQAELQLLADEAGCSMSEYVRGKVFGE